MVSGPIFQLRLPGRNRVFISNYALFDELCDEKRFGKFVDGNVFELRYAIHDGLFTAHTDEPAWGVAHRILGPAFGPLAIRDMFDGTLVLPLFIIVNNLSRNARDCYAACSEMGSLWARPSY